MTNVLLVAATSRELGPHGGLACGIGPVEAAATTAHALSLRSYDAVLHVGIAGGRGLEIGALVIGSTAVYTDLAAEIPVVDRVDPDPRLVRAVRGALPRAPFLPIVTSAAVGRGGSDAAVEAMEGFGVLRAAALAGVPAIEVRAISNEIGEPDRLRWQIPAALDALASAVTSVLVRLEGALT